MFFPDKMCRVTLVSHKSHLKQMIEVLYNLKLLHMKEYSKTKEEDLPIGSPLENAEKISEILLAIQAVEVQLQPILEIKRKPIEWDLKKSERFVNSFKEGVSRLRESLKTTESEIGKRNGVKEVLDFVKDTGLKSFSLLKGYENLKYLSGYVSSLENLKLALKGLDFELLTSGVLLKRGYPVILFVKSTDVERAREILQKFGFSEIIIDLGWKRDSVNEESRLLEEEIKRLESEKSGLEKKLKTETENNMPYLKGLRNNLQREIVKSEVPLKFAVSNHTFIIQGWLPENKKEILRSRLSGITDNLYLEIEEVKQGEAPIQLGNKGIIKPFEFFIRLYSFPNYNELDPTFLVFFTFPIFFGMMLGDIGYGLILLCSFAFIRYRIKKMPSLSTVLMISAMLTIIFGFIFGEFFGAEEIFGYNLHPIIQRSHNINTMLMLAVLVGLVHVNIGIIFGFINALKHRSYRHAVGKLSWIILQTGGILYGLTFIGITLLDPNISLFYIVLGLIGLVIGEGFIGIVEIPKLISNILSYARIAAIGLASVSLAIVVNEMAGGMFQAGGFFILMGVMLLMAGHAINTLVGLLGSFLQSLRLHYVEMFSKFYMGNGERYKPFGT